jgi:hypothetical protein
MISSALIAYLVNSDVPVLNTDALTRSIRRVSVWEVSDVTSRVYIRSRLQALIRLDAAGCPLEHLDARCALAVGRQCGGYALPVQRLVPEGRASIPTHFQVLCGRDDASADDNDVGRQALARLELDTGDFSSRTLCERRDNRGQAKHDALQCTQTTVAQIVGDREADTPKRGSTQAGHAAPAASHKKALSSTAPAPRATCA